MATTINPQSWLSLNLSIPSQLRVFIQQLVTYLTNIVSGFTSQISSLNNSAGLSRQDLGALPAGTTTVNCANFGRVWISASLPSNSTLALTNLAQGTEVRIYLVAVGARTITITATDQSSVSYTAFAYWNSTPKVNLSSSGWSQSAGTEVKFIGDATTIGGTNYLSFLVLYG